jgi:hypothetical protein
MACGNGSKLLKTQVIGQPAYAGARARVSAQPPPRPEDEQTPQ